MTMKGLMTFSPKRYSLQRAPYRPQPRMVVKAKQHMATAVKMVIQLP